MCVCECVCEFSHDAKQSSALNQNLHQIIRVQLSRNNLGVLGVSARLAIGLRSLPSGCLLSCLLHMRLRGQAWHLSMGNRTGYGTARLLFICCRSVAAQGAVAYLVSAFDSSSFPVSGCHVSLLVKLKERKKKKVLRKDERLDSKACER